MGRVRAAVMAVLLLLATVSCSYGTGKSIKPLKGFDKKVYDGALALYASSKERGIEDRFICTAQVIKKVEGGYELLSAGHCTPANTAQLPSDMTFKVATDLDGPLMPVKLVAAKVDEPVDWAVYYFPTTLKLPLVKLGDEHHARLNDPTIDVNFSLALAKEVSKGFVSSTVQIDGPMAGFFEVTQFDSHGASGSSVVDERTHEIIGIVIAGVDGATVPMWVEPISVIKAQIADLDVAKLPELSPKSFSPIKPHRVPLWEK